MQMGMRNENEGRETGEEADAAAIYWRWYRYVHKQQVPSAPRLSSHMSHIRALPNRLLLYRHQGEQQPTALPGADSNNPGAGVHA